MQDLTPSAANLSGLNFS